MASIFTARPPQLNLCSRLTISNCRPLFPLIEVLKFRSSGFPIPSFRSKNTKKLQSRQRPFPTSASDSSDGNYVKEGKDESKATENAQGPPFLTILAGFFILFLLCWIISSTVMSLVSLVVKLIPLK